MANHEISEYPLWTCRSKFIWLFVHAASASYQHAYNWMQKVQGQTRGTHMGHTWDTHGTHMGHCVSWDVRIKRISGPLMLSCGVRELP